MIGTQIRGDLENLMLCALEDGARIDDLLDIVELVAIETGDESAAECIRAASRDLWRSGARR